MDQSSENEEYLDEERLEDGSLEGASFDNPSHAENSTARVNHVLIDSVPETTTVGLEDDPLEGNSFDNRSHAERSTPQLNQVLINSVPKITVGLDEPNDANSLTEDDAPESYVFFFQATFCRKLFRSQLRPGHLYSKNVFGNSVDDVLRCIWRRAKLHVTRKVVFNNEVPAWCDKEQPDFEDIGEFVMLQDQTKKKLYAISNITNRVLRSWRGKMLKVFVYVYSLSVESNAQHQKLQRVLISPQNPDRSGATSTRDDSALADELRSSHPDIEGHYSSWLLWANYINSSGAHEHDRLKHADAPPLELAKYFRWAAVSESARLQAMHRGMVVANVVNTGWTNEVADLEKDVSLALTILQGVSNKLTAMKARGSAGSEVFDAMESTLQPVESELSRILSSRVTDCDDVDHV